jgi:cytochrome c553
MQRVSFMIGLVALVFVGCDKGSATPPTAPSETEVAAAEGEVQVPETWKEAASADLDTQVAFMKAKVLPAMKPVLEQGGETAMCATCHGPDNQRPQDFLPHLTMADGNIAEFTSRPDVSAFMAEHVVPAMAEAMGEAPFDPATGQGFGCAGCHAIDAG